MDVETQVPLRKSFENRCIGVYVNFSPPTTAPNFLELPDRYQFSTEPGYVQFCMAFEAEYIRGTPSAAREFYEQACELGHPLANYCYGLWFLNGDRPDVPKDLKKAFHKFCAAHKFGLGQATYQLADFYRTGKGKVTGRDVKKAFAFLLQSILDARVHWLLDGIPFWLLGLSYALGRGPSTASVSTAVHYLEKAIRYAMFKQDASNAIISAATASPISDVSSNGFFNGLLHLGILVAHFDEEEKQRQHQVRLNAMETFLNNLPPGQSMMTVFDFADLAKKFGLLYDEYLANAVNSERKARKVMTWKTFRAQTNGRAQLIWRYERQADVEHWHSLEPADLETREFIANVEAGYRLANSLRGAQADDYGFYLFPPGSGELNEDLTEDAIMELECGTSSQYTNVGDLDRMIEFPADGAGDNENLDGDAVALPNNLENGLADGGEGDGPKMVFI